MIENIDYLLLSVSLLHFPRSYYLSLSNVLAMTFYEGIIYDLRAGRTAGLTRVRGQFLLLLDLISLGMHYSVQCGEEARFASPGPWESFSFSSDLLGGYFDREPIFDICGEWGVREASNVENEPVASDIPNSGFSQASMDPITPTGMGGSRF